MRKLYGRTSNNITLQEAISNFPVSRCDNFSGVALLYSPNKCEFYQLKDSNLLDSQGKIIDDLSLVFEARVFHEEAELRWLNQLDGKGRAVLISELDISHYLEHSVTDLDAIDAKEQEYLLWGEKVSGSSTSGWTRLAEARIGAIDVPINSNFENGRIYLKTWEYLGEDEYGNVAVVEERLIKLVEKQIIKSEEK